MNRDNAKRNKDLMNTKRGIEDNNSSTATASVTDLGDTSRDVTDTADVSRASIAKGRGTVKNRTAADIATGKINSDESIIQGITQDNTNLERRQGQQQQQRSNAQDKTSKEIVDSGTSFKKDKSIDRADIYSTGESGTRHIERAQEKPVKKKEDKEKGSWKIEEEKRSRK
jgi:hypothetical protein